MDQRLWDLLHGKEDNYILPFLWMHSGNRDTLPAHVQEVYDSGVRALCVESRPHEHFMEEEWWGDMTVILQEAQKREMQVWILDDKNFPTGYANGLIGAKYPERRKWQLIENHVDVVGPAVENCILLEEREAEDRLVGAYAYRRTQHDESLDGEAIDLTANIQGRYLYWNVPAGVYRIFTLYQSRRGTARGRADYIHMIDPESVRVQIEAVYEPHYQHFASYFGNTLAGFFSDEPSFGNQQYGPTPTPHGMYDMQIGQPGVALPWNDEVLTRMNRTLHRDARGELAGLWYPHGKENPEVRIAYMDAITTMWREAFSMQLGEWCRAHGVMYIGHIIEDMNAHARIGCSGGHYFRALDGQDMAGIDVVLHQIIPGLSQHMHVNSAYGGMADPEFFDYVLAKLAASHAQIQPRMKGRAMCEVFGAYGWAEGTPMMKYLIDHLLVRGINYFVPHAFSPKYPDPDCPPHFNANGHNPQFSSFARLMHYTNQVSHLLSDARPVVDAAILYHAEAEWSGMPYMLVQKPARRLYEAQIDYHILPIDAILEQGCVEQGALAIGDMRYSVLIVPYAAYLPKPFLRKLEALDAQGLRILFVDGKAEGAGDMGRTIPLEALVQTMKQYGLTDGTLPHDFPLLRCAHWVREGLHIWMLVNESKTDAFDGEIQLPMTGAGVRLDLLLDRMQTIEKKADAYSIPLEPGQSAILVFGDALPDARPAKVTQRMLAPAFEWTLACKDVEGAIDTAVPIAGLFNVTGREGNDAFSGWMRYETTFTLEETDGLYALDLGVVGECAQVELNGVDLGERICAPYVLDVKGAAQKGLNHLTITVANTLVHVQRDGLSRFIQISPSGLLGPVHLLCEAYHPMGQEE